MILVDSSAWVDYDRANGSKLDRTLTRMIRAGGHEIAVTEPVMMEILAGARDVAGESSLRALLTSFSWIGTDAVADFVGAAHIYRQCRASGVTPRGLIDCMIANIALRTGVEVLAADADFANIATVVPLQLRAT